MRDNRIEIQSKQFKQKSFKGLPGVHTYLTTLQQESPTELSDDQIYKLDDAATFLKNINPATKICINYEKVVTAYNSIASQHAGQFTEWGLTTRF